MREAERQLQIAKAKRDALASVIEIEAKDELSFSWDAGEKRGLSKGAVVQRSIASEASLEIMDVATIRFMPSQSAAELESEFEQCEQALPIAQELQCENLVEAVEAAADVDAERDLKNLNANMRELLGDDSKDDIESAVNALKTEQEAYIAKRSAGEQIPTSLDEAVKQLRQAEQTFKTVEKEFEEKREALDRLKDSFNEAHAESLVRKQEVEGREADLKRRQSALETLRQGESDKQVTARVREHTTRLEKLKRNFKT